MANTFNLGNGNWAQKTEKLLAYNAENDNYKPLPFDFDRGSTATRVNKNGLIETVGVDEPRIDFLNNTKGHLLLEPSRTNLVAYSDDFGNSDWNKGTGTITTNTSISPDGTLSADKYSAVSTSSFAFLSQTKSADASQSYTYSIWIKKVSGSGVLKLAISDVNLATSSSNNINLTNEFVRYSFSIETGDLSNTGSIGAGFTNITSGDVIEVWGAQLEQGSYATSYIPTSGSAVTRLAETCNITGLEINAMNGATEGTLFLELEFEKESDGDAMQWRSSTSNVGRGFFYSTVMGFADTYGASGVTIYPLTQNSKLKAAFRLNSLSNATVFLNGTKGGTGNGNTWANIGQLLLNSTYWKMKINEIKMYNTALSDTELQALTQV